MSAPTPSNGRPYRVIAAIYLPAFAVLAFCYAFSDPAGIPFPDFFRDPTVTLGGHPLTGMLSHVGVLVWMAAAGICLFTGAVTYGRPADRSSTDFFLWAGVFSGVLLLDDLFLFHDDLATSYLGLDEKIVVGAYGVAAIVFIYQFRKRILDSDYLLLLVAGSFFGVSLGIDFLLAGWNSSLRIAFEDGCKLFGIVSWSAYFIQQCFREIRSDALS